MSHGSSQHSFDEGCLELAEGFLDDYTVRDSRDYDRLAQAIQDAIEDWLNENGYA